MQESATNVSRTKPRRVGQARRVGAAAWRTAQAVLLDDSMGRWINEAGSPQLVGFLSALGYLGLTRPTMRRGEYHGSYRHHESRQVCADCEMEDLREQIATALVIGSVNVLKGW